MSPKDKDVLTVVNSVNYLKYNQSSLVQKYAIHFGVKIAFILVYIPCLKGKMIKIVLKGFTE